VAQNDPTAFDRRAMPAAAMERYWLASDGWRIRMLDWPTPASHAVKGSILFLPGRGDCYEKYVETLEHWRERGWQVSAADWRGQAGSGRLGADAVTGHIEDFAQWVDDLRGLWADWAEGRSGLLLLAGHSMGGHLALRAVADGVLSPAPAGLILSTPMLGVFPEWLPLRLQLLLASAMASLGDPRRPAWKWSEKPGQLPKGRVNLLTHDPDRYADEQFWRDTRPELVMGPGSWGWVAAAARSMQHLARPDVLAKVRLPVFLLSASGDKLVSPRASRRAASLLPHVDFIEMEVEARHEILREADVWRDPALAAIDAFLDRLDHA
jgi:lysophospholipase